MQFFGSQYSTGSYNCLMLNPSGNVQRCAVGANLMCEKTLVWDAKMCLNTTDLGTKIAVNASTLIRFQKRSFMSGVIHGLSLFIFNSSVQ